MSSPTMLIGPAKKKDQVDKPPPPVETTAVKPGGPAPKPVPGLATGPKSAGPAAVEKVADTKPAPPKAVDPGAAKQARMANAKTLSPEDKIELAALWKWAETDERFVIATTVEKSYQFVRALEPPKRELLTTELVQKAEPLSAGAWEQLRLERFDKVTPADQTELLKAWGLPEDDPRKDRIFGTEVCYHYFRGLTSEEKKLVSASAIKACRKNLDVKAMREAKEKVEKEVAEKQAKESAQKKVADQHDKNKNDWAEYRKKAQAEIAKRLAALGMADFKWEDDFAKSADDVGAKVSANKQMSLAKQTKSFDAEWDKRINNEKKKRDVDKAVPKFALLKTSTLQDIKAAVLADEAADAAEFDKRCTAALATQRNPARESWVTLLGLTMYPKYESLTAQNGWAAHFTVDNQAYAQPVNITETTTPDELLEMLFGNSTGIEATLQAHVSLETGVTDNGDSKNPHKYWGGQYGLKYDNGRKNRYPPGVAVADVRAALDAALVEIKARLQAKAKAALDKACKL